MPLTAHQRRDLLHYGRRRDAEAIGDAINRLLPDNPDVDLLEVETVLRAATTTAFVISGEPFKVEGTTNCRVTKVSARHFCPAMFMMA